MENRVYIYTLSSTDDNVVRYVGQTINPSYRLNSHLKHDCRNLRHDNPRRIWIESVLSSGGSIAMNIIDECERDLSDERESEWIRFYFQSGNNLTNTGNPKSVYISDPRRSVYMRHGNNSTGRRKVELLLSKNALRRLSQLRGKAGSTRSDVFATMVCEAYYSQFANRDRESLVASGNKVILSLTDVTCQYLEEISKELRLDTSATAELIAVKGKA